MCECGVQYTDDGTRIQGANYIRAEAIISAGRSASVAYFAVVSRVISPLHWIVYSIRYFIINSIDIICYACYTITIKARFIPEDRSYICARD